MRIAIVELEALAGKDGAVVDFQQAYAARSNVLEDDCPDFQIAVGPEDSTNVAIVRMTLEWEKDFTTYESGDICEFDAGTLHAEKTGPDGARIILGFK